MIILGITGTNGAGKGAVVKYLSKKGFIHYSVRDFIIEEINKQGLKINRDSMRTIANGLREKYGPSYVIDKIKSRAIENNRDCTLESIRCVGEIESLRKHNDFYLLAVDAPREIRYKRIKKRKSSTDSVNFDEFVYQEEREWYNDEPFKMNILKCIELADYKFINNKDLSSLYKKIDEFLISISKKTDNTKK